MDPGNPYVIHQHVSYEVNVSGESKSVINTDGSLESQYSLERHTHDQDQQHNGRSISRTSRASSLTDNDKRAG